MAGSTANDLVLGLAQRTALADDLMLLARFHDREPDAAMVDALRTQPPEQWFAFELSGATAEAAVRLIAETFDGMEIPASSARLDDLAAEYAALYLTYGYRVAPAESPWRDEDGLERQEPMFAVRDWYRRFGMRIADWRQRSDDHLVYELQFLAHVLRTAPNEHALRALARFLCDHPLAWVPHFAARALKRCRLPLYPGLALLTSAYLAQLAALLGTALEIDMTPAPLRADAAPAPVGAKTCADAPPAIYGGAPGW